MNWSTINVVWTTLALIGSIASTLIFIESIKDYKAVQATKSESPINRFIMKLNVARMSMLLFFAILTTELFFLFIGILAIITPPPNKILNNIVIGLFIAVGVILASASVLANYHRRIVVHTGE